MAVQIGDVLDGKYRIVRLLGEGRTGAVFEGENPKIHRRVAIKVLPSDLASNEEAVQRFEWEAQAASRMDSEHIVEVLDIGHLPNHERYMVMEFLEGESLAERLTKRGRLSPQAAAGYAIDVLEGLRAAHNAGIVHRDLRPDKVFLLAGRGRKRDSVKLVDFGISKFTSLSGEFSMTRTGAYPMSTPYYMSPEQAKGNRNVDHRADLYAVGVILYEAVVGEVPFRAGTFDELLFEIVLEQPVPLEQRVPGIESGFARIVEKAMARDPEHRFLSAGDFQAALRAWREAQPPAPDVTAIQGTAPAFDRTGSPASMMGLGAPASSMQPLGAPSSPPSLRPLTQESLASMNGYEGGGSRSKLTMILAAAVVVLGAGVLAWKRSADAEAEKVLAARAAEERTRAEKAELLKREAERARVLGEKAQAERARWEAERLREQTDRLRRLEEERKRDMAEQSAAAERKGRARPRGASVEAAPVVPTPPPQPSIGRKIRTEL